MPAEGLYNQSIGIYLESSMGEITKKKTLRRLSCITHRPPKETEEMFYSTIVDNVYENTKLIEYLKGLEKYKPRILSIQ